MGLCMNLFIVCLKHSVTRSFKNLGAAAHRFIKFTFFHRTIIYFLNGLAFTLHEKIVYVSEPTGKDYYPFSYCNSMSSSHLPNLIVVALLAFATSTTL